MTRRGYVAALVLVLLAAVLAGGTVLVNRASIDLAGRRAADLRAQTLWLARSAVESGAQGSHRVPTQHGVALVTVRRTGAGVSAEARLAGALAVAGASERYTPPQ